MKIVKWCKGITLLELLISIAIVGIMTSIAVPSFQSMIGANKVLTASNEFSAIINLARSEAVKRGNPVTVCPSNDQATCSTTLTDWTANWIIFVDKSTLGSVDTSDTLLRVKDVPAKLGVTISDTYLSFSPSGFATTNNGTGMGVQLSMNGTNKYICVSSTGRIRRGKNSCV